MKTLARFTIRPAGKMVDQHSLASNAQPGDLILGALFKDQNSELLKPGVIYELKEILGQLMVIEVGEAAIGRDLKTSYANCNWMHDVNHILAFKGEFLLTKEELLSLSNK